MVIEIGEALLVELVESGRFRGRDHNHDSNDCKGEEADGYDGVCPLEFVRNLFRRIVLGCGGGWRVYLSTVACTRLLRRR